MKKLLKEFGIRWFWVSRGVCREEEKEKRACPEREHHADFIPDVCTPLLPISPHLLLPFHPPLLHLVHPQQATHRTHTHSAVQPHALILAPISQTGEPHPAPSRNAAPTPRPSGQHLPVDTGNALAMTRIHLPPSRILLIPLQSQGRKKGRGPRGGARAETPAEKPPGSPQWSWTLPGAEPSSPGGIVLLAGRGGANACQDVREDGARRAWACRLACRASLPPEARRH